MQKKKVVGGLLLAVGVVIVGVSVGPMAWGLGWLGGACIGACGFAMLTDHTRPVRVPPHERDGA